MAAVIRDGGKVYIPDVRKVTWDTGEMCEFGSCVVSAEQALGEQVAYDFVLGVSGAAFRLTLNVDPWEPGSYSLTQVVPDAYAPVRRTFDAIGREYTIREMGAEEADAEAIMASIDAGVPVLARGVAGPSDFSLVTGYDDGGTTLLGWSTFQNIPDDHPYPPDSTGYFRKPEWHANTRGYILLGGRKTPPGHRAVILDALRWAVRIVSQPAVGDMPAGLRAYDAWADAMLRDEDFIAGDADRLGRPYLGTLCNQMMIDDRRSAGPFLRQCVCAHTDLAQELLQAAACYDETCDLRSLLGELVKEDFSVESILGLADGGTRARYAATLRCMREHDEEALRHIEHLLARIGE